MRKYFNISTVLSLALIIFGLVSCEMEPEVADPISTEDYPTATFISDFTGTAIKEGDTIYYKVYLDKYYHKNLTFTATVTGGTGSDADFEVTDGTIKAYTNDTAEIMIVTLQDYVADEDCTVDLEIGCTDLGIQYDLNPLTVNPVLNLTVENYIAEGIEIYFDWDYDINVGNDDLVNKDYGPVESAHNFVDFDIYVADAAGFDIANPWPNTFEVYDAATGSVPEAINLAGFPDGTYVLFANLYENDFVYLAQGVYDVLNEDTLYYEVEDRPIPIQVNVIKQGVFTNVYFDQDDSQAVSSLSPDGYWMEQDVNGIICQVKIENGVYTVSDFNGTTIVDAKSDISDKKIDLKKSNTKPVKK